MQPPTDDALRLGSVIHPNGSAASATPLYKETASPSSRAARSCWPTMASTVSALSIHGSISSRVLDGRDVSTDDTSSSDVMAAAR
jgi:hypothetical protein